MFIKYEDDLLEVSHSEILDKLLQQCITDYFPQLIGVGIKIGYVIRDNDFGGVKAGTWVVLFLSKKVPLASSGLKWIVVHELCHFINLHNPDKIFKKKVPKDIWETWKKLEDKKELKCDAGFIGREKLTIIRKAD